MLPAKGYCSETADSDMEESDVESIKSQQLSSISTTEEVQHQSFNNRLTDEVEFECNSDTELILQEDQLVKCICILRYLYSTASKWYGYKFTLHYFHGYAVSDRLDLSELSNEHPQLRCPDSTMLLPSNTDMCHLRTISEPCLSVYY